MSGFAKAIRELQEELSKTEGIDLKADGVIGAETLRALLAVSGARTDAYLSGLSLMIDGKATKADVDGLGKRADLLGQRISTLDKEMRKRRGLFWKLFERG